MVPSWLQRCPRCPIVGVGQSCGMVLQGDRSGAWLGSTGLAGSSRAWKTPCTRRFARSLIPARRGLARASLGLWSGSWRAHTAWVRVRLLGPVSAETGGVGLRLGSRKQRAVFALLALQVNSPVALDRLVDELWHDEPPARATLS